MMTDYHVHNHFSPDSQADTRAIIKKAIEKGFQEICITNHPEIHHPETGEDIFDLTEALMRFKAIKEELDEIYLEFPPLHVRIGMELGYNDRWMDGLTQLIRQTELDFILGSVHVVRGVIIASHLFAEQLYSQTDEKTAYRAYFDQMEKLIEWGQIDAVAHFDICKKFGHHFYGPFQPEKYKAQIMSILRRMKEKNIGLELNTKCMKSKCRELFPHPTILNWALETGIRHFTIGSDAHTQEDVGKNIPEAMRIARSVGVTKLATYHHRKARLSVF